MSMNELAGTDLVGRLVRWEYEGQWFTARITEDGCSDTGAQWIGQVVDPGNFIGLNADLFGARPLSAGERVPNLLSALFTVVDES